MKIIMTKLKEDARFTLVGIFAACLVASGIIGHVVDRQKALEQLRSQETSLQSMISDIDAKERHEKRMGYKIPDEVIKNRQAARNNLQAKLSVVEAKLYSQDKAKNLDPNAAE